MENKKNYLVIGIIILIVIIFIIGKNSEDKEIATEPENIAPVEEVVEKQENKKEAIEVAGYHLVTYAQSAKNNSFIKEIIVTAQKEGNIRFVIGTINSESAIEERMEFELACIQGENTFNLLDERYFLKTGEYLFMDIYGQDVLYTQNEAQAKSLVQTENSKILGKMFVEKSEFLLPFEYTLEKVQNYNVLVIGNSITTQDGGKGAAATSENRDYYTLTKTRLSNTFENVKMSRINAIDWEKSEGTDERKNWINEKLKPDNIRNLDLVIFQLGENYTNQESLENDVKDMTDRIRKYSPNAEMIWIGLWNKNQEVFNKLPGICERQQIKFLNINDLVVTDYETIVDEISYPNNEAMQIISNRIIEVLKFEF